MIRSSSAPIGKGAFLRGQGFQRVGRGQWLNPNGQSRNMGQIMRHSYGSQFRNLSQPATPQTPMQEVMPQQAQPAEGYDPSKDSAFARWGGGGNPEGQPPGLYPSEQGGVYQQRLGSNVFGRTQGEFNPWTNNSQQDYGDAQKRLEDQGGATRGFNDSSGPSFSGSSFTQQFNPQMMQRLASILGGFNR